jgi:hypothetical protein
VWFFSATFWAGVNASHCPITRPKRHIQPGTFDEIGPMIGFHAAALFADACSRGLKVDYARAYEGVRKNDMEQCMLPWNCKTPLTVLDKCYLEKGFFPALKKGEKETVPPVNEFERR